jgi:hypothetical protein
MSPLMQQALERKRLRRVRLIGLPYPEKVRIVEQMRAAVRRIRAVAGEAPRRPGTSIAPTTTGPEP